MLEGLKYTIIIALGSVVIGIVLGAILAVFKVLPQKYIFARVLNAIASVYIGIIRVTHIMVQLLLAYYGIFASSFRGLE